MKAINAKDLLIMKIERVRNLSSLKFPYPGLRTGQRQMMHKILESIMNKEPLLIHAPTGLGKTMASLFPALKALTRNEISHILYLTAKKSTRNEVQKAVKLLRENSSLPIFTIFLSPQDEICLRHLDCPPRYYGDDELFYTAIFDLFQRSQDYIFTQKDILQVAGEYNLCPYHLMLASLPFCDLIVTDYNHVFNPSVRLNIFLNDKNVNCAILIDEAHNLVARAREMFSAEIDIKTLKELYLLVKGLIKIAENKNTKNEDELILILETLITYFKDLLELQQKNDIEYFSSFENDSSRTLAGQNFRATKNKAVFLINTLRNLQKKIKELITNINSDKLHYLYNIQKQVQNFIHIATNYWSDAFCNEVYFSNNNIVFKIACLDSAKVLFKQYQTKHYPIFFSGSMQPMHYFRNSLIDLDNQKPQTLILSSPFPRENFCVIQTSFLKNDYQNRDFFLQDLVETVSRAVHAKKGNYMVYLPSFSYLAKFKYVLEANLNFFSGFKIISQKQRQNSIEQQSFIDAFKNNKNIIGLAVLGGSFSEGVDFAGDQLLGVIIVGLGLATVSDHQEILKSYYDYKMNDGFFYAYRSPGFNKLLQASGRVIRTEDDRGFVIFCDNRLLQDSYHSLWPDNWQRRIAHTQDELTKILDDFWRC